MTGQRPLEPPKGARCPYVVCYSSLTTDMAFELELISPIDIAKDIALAVQEYTLLSAQSLANFFRRPLYMGDMLQQADLIGVGSLPIVILTGLSVGALLALNCGQHVATFRRGHAHRPTGIARHGHGTRTADHRADGGRAQRLGHGQRTRLDDRH